MFSFFGIIDLAAIAPFYLATGLDLRSLRALRMLRLVRILKLARYSLAMRRFTRAIQIAREEIVLFLCVTAILLTLAAAGIYHLSMNRSPKSLPRRFTDSGGPSLH